MNINASFVGVVLKESEQQLGGRSDHTAGIELSADQSGRADGLRPQGDEQLLVHQEMQAAGLMRIAGEIMAQFGDAACRRIAEILDRLIGRDVLDEVDGEG